LKKPRKFEKYQIDNQSRQKSANPAMKANQETDGVDDDEVNQFSGNNHVSHSRMARSVAVN
jgi:hypothetical protein